MRHSWISTVARWLVAVALTGVGMCILPSAGTAAPDPLQGQSIAGMPAKGNVILGQARVTDGDTLTISGVRIRLEGIDAPETGQLCNLKWIGTWHCGAVASAALARMVEGHDISCESRGQDKYGRMLGICYVGSRDINAEMVRAGLAWAFVKIRPCTCRRKRPHAPPASACGRHRRRQRGTIAQHAGQVPRSRWRRPPTDASSRAP